MSLATPWGPSPPTQPRLPGALRRLTGEVDRRWPNRPRQADGWIGDAAHALRVSDHNPDRRGLVHAVDVTASGRRALALVTAATAHPSTRYVIHDRLIWRRANQFRPEYYGGPNPHEDHVHISIGEGRRSERSRLPWLAGV